MNFNFSFLFIKTSKDLSAENYQQKKKKKNVCERYYSLSEEKKNKMQQYSC